MAIAELISRSKEQLVLIRTYRKALVLHTMYTPNEVRELSKSESDDIKVSEIELELGIGLSDRLNLGGVQSAEL